MNNLAEQDGKNTGTGHKIRIWWKCMKRDASQLKICLIKKKRLFVILMFFFFLENKNNEILKMLPLWVLLPGQVTYWQYQMVQELFYF